jgi:hypothetical protein
MMGTARKTRAAGGASLVGLAFAAIVAAVGCGNPAPGPGPKAPRPQAGEHELLTPTSAPAEVDAKP